MAASKHISQEVRNAFAKKTQGVGIMCLPFESNYDKDEEYLLVHTNIVIPFYYTYSFWRDVIKIDTQIQTALASGDIVARTASNKFFSGNWETITVWKNEQAIKNFYTKGEHAKVMMKWTSYMKAGENYMILRYKIQGKDMDIKGYRQTKTFFAMVKAGALELA